MALRMLRTTNFPELIRPPHGVLVPNEDSDNETRAAARLQDFISLMEDGQAYVRDFEAIKATASDGAETTDGTEDHAAYDWTALVEPLERAKYNVWDDLSPSLRQEASILQTVMESLRDCESTSENAMGGGDATTMAVVPLWTSSVIRQAWKAVCDKHQKRLVTSNNNMSSEESATATSALHLIWPPKHKHGGAAGATTVDSIFDVVRLIQDICATPNSSRTHNGPQGWRRLSKASLPHASTETWHVLYMYFICEVARQDWSRRRRSLQMVSSTLSTEQAASELASLDHWNEFVLARVDGDLYESRAGQAAMFLYALDWFMEVDDCQPAAASLPQRPADLTMSTVLKQDFGPSHRNAVWNHSMAMSLSFVAEAMAVDYYAVAAYCADMVATSDETAARAFLNSDTGRAVWYRNAHLTSTVHSTIATPAAQANNKSNGTDSSLDVTFRGLCYPLLIELNVLVKERRFADASILAQDIAQSQNPAITHVDKKRAYGVVFYGRLCQGVMLYRPNANYLDSVDFSLAPYAGPLAIEIVSRHFHHLASEVEQHSALARDVKTFIQASCRQSLLRFLINKFATVENIPPQFAQLIVPAIPKLPHKQLLQWVETTTNEALLYPPSWSNTAPSHQYTDTSGEFPFDEMLNLTLFLGAPSPGASGPAALASTSRRPPASRTVGPSDETSTTTASSKWTLPMLTFDRKAIESSVESTAAALEEPRKNAATDSTAGVDPVLPVADHDEEEDAHDADHQMDDALDSSAERQEVRQNDNELEGEQMDEDGGEDEVVCIKDSDDDDDEEEEVEDEPTNHDSNQVEHHQAHAQYSEDDYDEAKMDVDDDDDDDDGDDDDDDEPPADSAERNMTIEIRSSDEDEYDEENMSRSTDSEGNAPLQPAAIPDIGAVPDSDEDDEDDEDETEVEDDAVGYAADDSPARLSRATSSSGEYFSPESSPQPQRESILQLHQDESHDDRAYSEAKQLRVDHSNLEGNLANARGDNASSDTANRDHSEGESSAFVRDATSSASATPNSRTAESYRSSEGGMIQNFGPSGLNVTTGIEETDVEDDADGDRADDSPTRLSQAMASSHEYFSPAAGGGSPQPDRESTRDLQQEESHRDGTDFDKEQMQVEPPAPAATLANARDDNARTDGANLDSTEGESSAFPLQETDQRDAAISTSATPSSRTAEAHRISESVVIQGFSPSGLSVTTSRDSIYDEFNLPSSHEMANPSHGTPPSNENASANVDHVSGTEGDQVEGTTSLEPVPMGETSDAAFNENRIGMNLGQGREADQQLNEPSTTTDEIANPSGPPRSLQSAETKDLNDNVGGAIQMPAMHEAVDREMQAPSPPRPINSTRQDSIEVHHLKKDVRPGTDTQDTSRGEGEMEGEFNGAGEGTRHDVEEMQEDDMNDDVVAETRPDDGDGYDASESQDPGTEEEEDRPADSEEPPVRDTSRLMETTPVDALLAEAATNKAPALDVDDPGYDPDSQGYTDVDEVPKRRYHETGYEAEDSQEHSDDEEVSEEHHTEDEAEQVLPSSASEQPDNVVNGTINRRLRRAMSEDVNNADDEMTDEHDGDANADMSEGEEPNREAAARQAVAPSAMGDACEKVSSLSAAATRAQKQHDVAGTSNLPTGLNMPGSLSLPSSDAAADALTLELPREAGRAVGDSSPPSGDAAVDQIVAEFERNADDGDDRKANAPDDNNDTIPLVVQDADEAAPQPNASNETEAARHEGSQQEEESESSDSVRSPPGDQISCGDTYSTGSSVGMESAKGGSALRHRSSALQMPSADVEQADDDPKAEMKKVQSHESPRVTRSGKKQIPGRTSGDAFPSTVDTKVDETEVGPSINSRFADPSPSQSRRNESPATARKEKTQAPPSDRKLRNQQSIAASSTATTMPAQMPSLKPPIAPKKRGQKQEESTVAKRRRTDSGADSEAAPASRTRSHDTSTSVAEPLGVAASNTKRAPRSVTKKAPIEQPSPLARSRRAKPEVPEEEEDAKPSARKPRGASSTASPSPARSVVGTRTRAAGTASPALDRKDPPTAKKAPPRSAAKPKKGVDETSHAASSERTPPRKNSTSTPARRSSDAASAVRSALRTTPRKNYAEPEDEATDDDDVLPLPPSPPATRRSTTKAPSRQSTPGSRASARSSSSVVQASAPDSKSRFTTILESYATEEGGASAAATPRRQGPVTRRMSDASARSASPAVSEGQTTPARAKRTRRETVAAAPALPPLEDVEEEEDEDDHDGEQSGKRRSTRTPKRRKLP